MSYQKSVCAAYLLWFFLGFWGAHRFYLERPVSGVIWLLTAGLCGIGWLIDFCLIPMMVEQCNSRSTHVHHHHHTTTVVMSPPQPAVATYPQTTPATPPYQYNAQPYVPPQPVMQPPPQQAYLPPAYNPSAPPV